MKSISVFSKSIVILIFIFTITTNINCKSEKKKSNSKDTLQMLWQTEKVFETPESVFFDEIRNCIYVSNINGKPSDLDSNGYLSKLTENGEIVEIKWITGLNAPKGMALYKEKLFVSDINYLIEIDIEKQEIVKRYFAENSQFLNDVEVDNNGKVYVSDISTNTIYRLENESLEIFIQNEELNHPNGLHFSGASLIAGCGNNISMIDIKSREFQTIRNNTGSIDGIEMIDDENFIISDWLGNINIVYQNDSLNLILSTAEQGINAADIDFVKSKKMLLVPTFKDNRIVAYEIVKK